jgi:hypothetical protein
LNVLNVEIWSAGLLPVAIIMLAGADHAITLVRGAVRLRGRIPDRRRPAINILPAPVRSTHPCWK